MIRFHFFARSCPDLPTPFVEEAIFTPFYASWEEGILRVHHILLYLSVSQLGVILYTGGYLAMSGDIFERNWEWPLVSRSQIFC